MRKLFDKDLDDKFMEDINNMSVNTESDFQDSYFNLEKQRIQKEIQQSKQKAALRKNIILEEIKKDQIKNHKIIEEFQFDMNEVAKITKGQQKNVIDQTKLKQIKKQVGEIKQTIVLTDQIIKDQVTKNINNNTSSYKKSVDNQKNDQKIMAMKLEEQKIQQKIEKMFRQREILAMTRQDERSMKYEQFYHSNLLLDRFYTPKVRILYQNDTIINFLNPEPCQTFTNLFPQRNTENNVLSKHSRPLALKNLKLLTKSKLSFKKMDQKQINLIKLENAIQKNKIEYNKILNILNEGNNESFLKIELVNLLKEYFMNLSEPLKQLELISEKSYQFKFIQQHLQNDQKGVNIDLDMNSDKKMYSNINKSLSKFIQELGNIDRIKQLKITFENLCDLSGINKLKELQCIQFQYNRLRQIKQIIQNSNLIQINLSNNELESYEGIEKLKWLRYVNLQKNKISKMIKFCALNYNANGSVLQYLNLSFNKIKQIEGIQSLCNLRKLNLSNNQISQIICLDKLYFLSELNLSHNRIKYLSNINKCILLKTLNVSHNYIENVLEDIVLIFLSEFNLTKNKLRTFQRNLILPSLQYLYLDQNEFHQTPKSVIYLPNLKVLNADNNQLQNFSPVWELLRYSNLLEILKYDNNDGLTFVSEKVKQLYEHMIYQKMKNLKILNQNSFSIGLKRYYESIYNILLQPFKQQELNRELQGFEQKVSFMLKENKFIDHLEQEKNPFAKNSIFLKYKSSTISKNMLQIVNYLNIKEKIQPKCDPIQSSLKSIFYHYDNYQKTLNNSLHKIRGLVLKWKYAQNKKRNFYVKNKERIRFLLKNLLNLSIRFNINHAIQKFKMINLSKYAIKIQKVWRGYLLRKKMKKLFKNMKVRHDDDFQFLEQPDIDFFYQPVQQYELKFPQNIDIQIIRPEFFSKADQIVKNISNNQKNVEIKPIRNNFMDQSKTSNFNNSNKRQDSKKQKKLPPIIDKKQQTKKIMEDWGFKNEQTVLRMKLKAERKKKLLEKQKEKNMTATERYERFKQAYKK